MEVCLGYDGDRFDVTGLWKSWECVSIFEDVEKYARLLYAIIVRTMLLKLHRYPCFSVSLMCVYTMARASLYNSIGDTSLGAA